MTFPFLKFGFAETQTRPCDRRPWIGRTRDTEGNSSISIIVGGCLTRRGSSSRGRRLSNTFCLHKEWPVRPLFQPVPFKRLPNALHFLPVAHSSTIPVLISSHMPSTQYRNLHSSGVSYLKLFTNRSRGPPSATKVFLCFRLPSEPVIKYFHPGGALYFSATHFNLSQLWDESMR